MKSNLSSICDYRKEKVEVSVLDLRTYISTENMLPNRGGVTLAASLPTTAQTQAFFRGDVLVSNIRPYFKKIWQATFDGGCSNDVLVFSAKPGVQEEFLYYILSDDAFFDYSMATSKGTKMPRGDKTAIMNYQVPTFGEIEQKSIASILRSLDNKIELNNRINENLEQQAAILVNDYCATETNTLELGKIMSFENGFAFQSKSYLSSGRYRIITIKNVQDGKINSQGSAFIDDVPSRMKEGCFLSIGDVLLSLTGNVGRVGIVYENDLLLNQRVAKFIPADSAILPWLYYFFRQHSTKVSLETIAKGTAQQNLSPIETLKLQVPFEMEPVKKLSAILYPFFNHQIANEIESLRLTELRDCLLPKLISGELDVSEINL